MGGPGGSDDDERGEPEDPARERIPTPQELAHDMNAVQEAVEAVEEAEARGLLQPWTRTPRPGKLCCTAVLHATTWDRCLCWSACYVTIAARHIE